MGGSPTEAGPVRVPMADLAARHAANAEAVEHAVIEVLRSGRWVGGPVVAEAEAALAARCGRPLAVGVNSGTDALRLALQALGVGPGDEVVVPAVSFFATLEAVLQAGARPVVVDVLPERPLLDPVRVAEARTEHTACVVPVALFGSRPPALAHLGLPVVDDLAQAMSAVGPLGEGALSAVSFYPSKVLGAAGDGGLLLCSDADLAARVRLLANHGMRGERDFSPVSGHLAGNSRLDAVQAALLLASLPLMEARRLRRLAVGRALDAVVGPHLVPWDADGALSLYVIRHPRRDDLSRALAARGVATRVYYPYTLAELAPRFPGARALPCPEAEAFRDEALALPCHADLDDEQVDHLVTTLGALL